MSQYNYQYTIIKNDSLTIIAQKHGLMPIIEQARRIWQDHKNANMYTYGLMNGRKVRRQLHMGNNKYEGYNHQKFSAGYRGYDDPHQIILYEGEILWIPEVEGQDISSNDNGNILHKVTHNDLISELSLFSHKKYNLVIPYYIVKMPKEEVNESDKFVLIGKNEKGNILYKETLNMRTDKIENDPYIELHFYATPQNLFYTLDILPGPDDNGNSQDAYTIVDNQSYFSDYDYT
jgi:hypothetical protein